MNNEQQRLKNSLWKHWGPYITDRQWGTVREDYSPDGSAWEYTSHDMARSKAWRWGEEGIAGICDSNQLLCFSLALWNKKDPIIKERYFGLTGNQGNHGEDVKELYYYLDSTPTHSYMKMLYKYPQHQYPYQQLLDENKRRGKLDPEYELIDTGIFDDDAYFDVFTEYAKASEHDILIRITAHNRGKNTAGLNLLPTLWFRNTWAWGYNPYKPLMFAAGNNGIEIDHNMLGKYFLYCAGNPSLLFCENETNTRKLYDSDCPHIYFKDGINEHIVSGSASVNPDRGGTKAAVNYDFQVPAGQSATVTLRLTRHASENPFDDFDSIFKLRVQEADIFYQDLQKDLGNDDEKMIQRQAFAGMLWNKQFFYYDVSQWLNGDPAGPPPAQERKTGRNHEWKHLNNADIISMPDKWEYPWYASWDLAFHCIALAEIDADFAKSQLLLLTKEWYMHPNGQFPAYEWSFGDVNPPVHAWATAKVYQTDKNKNGGKGDIAFLEAVFLKLLLNFTWWVNRKDTSGNNIFEGGFLGLDNIGVFDRSSPLPTGGYIEQADGTSWMAMFSLNMMRISFELAYSNKVYSDMSTKFFEHFLYIAGAMALMGEQGEGLWDETDQFYYDQLLLPSAANVKLKVRSMVGLIPMFAVEVLDSELLISQPEFLARGKWFLDNRPELANLVSRWYQEGEGHKFLLSLLRGHRLKRILERMLDETEFLSPYGIRAISKYHLLQPYKFQVDDTVYSVAYTPGESNSNLFGGNSNWRGPIWMPMNYLIIESLERFHDYFGPDFTVEYPSKSGVYKNLKEVAHELGRRLICLFTRDQQGSRPVNGDYQKLQTDPYFKDHILFYEYFHGDNGKGLGAGHQTGWTGLIAKLLQPRIEQTDKEQQPLGE